jgi:hypothetical protein
VPGVARQHSTPLAKRVDLLPKRAHLIPIRSVFLGHALATFDAGRRSWQEAAAAVRSGETNGEQEIPVESRPESLNGPARMAVRPLGRIGAMAQSAAMTELGEEARVRSGEGTE